MPDLPESRSAGQTRLRSVPVEVRVCVGHARPTVAELLELRQDAVLPLDRRIEDPVELYVGDRLGLDGALIGTLSFAFLAADTMSNLVWGSLGDRFGFRAVYLGALISSLVGMLLLVLTHLILFVRASNQTKAWLIAVPFLAALLDEGSGWLIRFVHPLFAYMKIAGFLLLQGSLAALVGVAIWSVFFGSAEDYRDEEPQ